MSFRKVNKDADQVADSSGGSYINSSGIYPVSLNMVSVQVNNQNARSLDFNYKYEGNDSVLYGLKLDNNDGSENFGAKVFDKLCVVLDIDDVSEPEVETHIVGKDKKEQDFSVLTDFTGVEVLMRVQFEYSIIPAGYKNAGSIRETRQIRNFYRASDMATASEIVNDSETKGSQYTKDLEYAANITYKDGLTAEDVKAWKESKKSGATPKTATNSSTAGSAPKTKGFGQS